MRHELWRDKVLALLDGELPEKDRSGVEEHISSCSDCADLRAASQAVSRLLKAEAEPASSETFVRSVMRALPHAKAQPEPSMGLGELLRWATPAFALGVSAFLMIAEPGTSDPLATDDLLLTGVSEETTLLGALEDRAPDFEDLIGISVEDL